MNFLRNFLASFLALIIFSVLSVFVMIALIGGLTAEKQVVVKANSVLHLKLDTQINELEADDPFSELPLFGDQPAPVGLVQLKQAIAHARENDNIRGIYLDVSYPMAGFSTLEEIRQSLIDFRESGKWVIAYSDMMSESAYYLASAADKIYLNPEGEMEFNGLSVEVMFFKRMFDKLEIKPEIFRVGDFKSAVEPFMLEKMSDENRLQLTEMINSIHGHILQRVSESRNVPVERLREIAQRSLVREANNAVEYRLVDSLLYLDQVRDDIRNRIGLAADEDIEFVAYKNYKKTVSTYKRSDNEIAVIVAEGTIMPGKSGSSQGVIGADTFNEELRKARKNEKVKAVVIRINSPGGSFQASDAMWREIRLTSQQKPVIASMGDYAASGGYYLAMACDTIVAQPHTITGSIGIFSVLFDASGLLNNKIGITTDEVKTGEVGEMVTFTRPLTNLERSIWQRRTEDIYETFTGKAAEGRNMRKEDIKKVASGRVWTGVQAQDRRLVDVIGQFDDAVRIAAEKAGITDNHKVKYYPKPKPFLEQLFGSTEETVRVRALKNELGEFYPYFLQYQQLKTLQGVQARMPFELHFQ